jgi:hypothetical protein
MTMPKLLPFSVFSITQPEIPAPTRRWLFAKKKW